MTTNQKALQGFDTQFFEAVLALEFDVRNAEIDRRKDDTQYRRRNYVRAVFAYVEGNLFFLRQMAIKTGTHFSPTEYAALNGKYATVGDNGDLSEEIIKMSLRKHMKFAFNYYAKSAGIESQLDLGSDGWRLLAGAEKIRDRLVHPKGMDSLTVTDEELEQIGKALEWFCSLVQSELVRHGAAKGNGEAGTNEISVDARKGLEQLFRQSGMGREEFGDFLIERGHPELVNLLNLIT